MKVAICLSGIPRGDVKTNVEIARSHFEGEIEFMHCDAQGNDINVLRSLGDYIKCLKSGVVEVANQVELYKGTDNTVNNAKQFLLSNGFFIEHTKGVYEADIRFKRL